MLEKPKEMSNFNTREHLIQNKNEDESERECFSERYLKIKSIWILLTVLTLLDMVLSVLQFPSL